MFSTIAKSLSALMVTAVFVSCASVPEANRKTADAACDTTQESNSGAQVCQAPTTKPEYDHSWHQGDRGGRMN